MRTLGDEEVRAGLVDPSAPEAFTRSVLDWDERARAPHTRWLALHRDLLRIRREDRAIARGGETGVEAAVLTPFAWLLRWLAPSPAQSRLLIVNLGRELDYAPPSEPLLAPPLGMRWSVALSTESPRYGGRGAPEVETEEGWIIPGPAAVLLAPQEREA
jgi:maltooligosyltrehalose trehalohydrolase